MRYYEKNFRRGKFSDRLNKKISEFTQQYSFRAAYCISYRHVTDEKPMYFSFNKKSTKSIVWNSQVMLFTNNAEDLYCEKILTDIYFLHLTKGYNILFFLWDKHGSGGNWIATDKYDDLTIKEKIITALDMLNKRHSYRNNSNG